MTAAAAAVGAALAPAPAGSDDLGAFLADLRGLRPAALQQDTPATTASAPPAPARSTSAAGATRIAVCIASTGHCKTQFAMSLAGLMAYFPSRRLAPEAPEQYIGQFMVESSGITHNQHQLVVRAREWGATHILWVEDDMQFPPDALHCLYGRRQPWVGANYPMRVGPPFEYTALGAGQQRVYTGPESTGLERCYYTGLGCTLMDVALFERIAPPWFETAWLGDGCYATSDAYLAQKVREAGIPIYVDHDLSQRVGHVGHHVYHCAEVAHWKQAQGAADGK